MQEVTQAVRVIANGVLKTKLAGHIFQYLMSLLLLLLCINVLHLNFLASLSPCSCQSQKNPCTLVLVGQSFLSNIQELSGFLATLIHVATFLGSTLMPVLSPRSNFAAQYCLTSQVKCTASLLGLCSAQLSCRSLLLLLALCSCCCSSPDS